MARHNGNTRKTASRPQVRKPRHPEHQPMDSVNQQHIRALHLASIR